MLDMLTIRDLFERGILVKGVIPLETPGGQQCGIPDRTIFVEYTPLNIKIEISGRSQLKSYKLALELLSKYIIKELV